MASTEHTPDEGTDSDATLDDATLACITALVAARRKHARAKVALERARAIEADAQSDANDAERAMLTHFDIDWRSDR